MVKGYFEGIVGNLELMPIYYPGWVMRVYYDLDDDDPITQVRNVYSYNLTILVQLKNLTWNIFMLKIHVLIDIVGTMCSSMQ